MYVESILSNFFFSRESFLREIMEDSLNYTLCEIYILEEKLTQKKSDAVNGMWELLWKTGKRRKQLWDQ